MKARHIYHAYVDISSSNFLMPFLEIVHPNLHLISHDYYYIQILNTLR